MSLVVLCRCEESRSALTRSAMSTPAACRCCASPKVASRSCPSRKTSVDRVDRSVGLRSRQPGGRPSMSRCTRPDHAPRCDRGRHRVAARWPVPGRVGGEVGGAEDVERRGAEVVAQRVALRWAVDVVELRQPVALLVVQGVRMLGTQPGQPGGIRAAPPLESTGHQRVDAQGAHVRRPRADGLRAVQHEHCVTAVSAHLDERGHVGGGAREREHQAHADHAYPVRQRAGQVIRAGRAAGRGQGAQSDAATSQRQPGEHWPGTRSRRSRPHRPAEMRARGRGGKARSW